MAQCTAGPRAALGMSPSLGRLITIFYSSEQRGPCPQTTVFPKKTMGDAVCPVPLQPWVPDPRAPEVGQGQAAEGWGGGWGDVARPSHPICFPGEVAVPDNGNTLDDGQPVLQGHEVEVCNLHRWPDTVVGQQSVHIVLLDLGPVLLQ